MSEGKLHESPLEQRTTRNPQLSASTTADTYSSYRDRDSPRLKDAWEGQGDFPLQLHKVSRRTIPVRGGSRILITGGNFREGVHVVFECTQLGLKPRMVTPKILQSTEMEIISPNLLAWWSRPSTDPSCASESRSLTLTMSLTCAGVKDDPEGGAPGTEMFATEESEAELLHTIVGLHRQLIQASLTAHLDLESDKAARQRTLTLLDLEQPADVSRSEHLALGVMYMLCDNNDQLSTKAMELIAATTAEGHDMLHLAVILGLQTLVREVARHMLVLFQRQASLDGTAEIFTKDLNGDTALDFATDLGHQEIIEVLVATAQAAYDFRKTIQPPPARPTPPPPPPRQHTLSSDHGPGSHGRNSPVPSHPSLHDPALDRPLPPTPLLSPLSNAPGFTHEPVSYFPMPGTSFPESQHQHAHEAIATVYNTQPPAQRIHTAQALPANTVQYSMPLPSTHGGPTIYAGPPSMAHPSPLMLHQETMYLPYRTPEQTPYPSPQQSMPVPYHYSHSSDSPRVNSVPLPYQIPQPHPTADPSVSHFPSRPLPLTPHSPAVPLPPPKHIVTRVSRPKQFTVSKDKDPSRSNSGSSSTSGYGSPDPSLKVHVA